MKDRLLYTLGKLLYFTPGGLLARFLLLRHDRGDMRRLAWSWTARNGDWIMALGGDRESADLLTSGAKAALQGKPLSYEQRTMVVLSLQEDVSWLGDFILECRRYSPFFSHGVALWTNALRKEMAQMADELQQSA